MTDGLTTTTGLRGTCRMPGDKSISHRAALLAALAGGASHIRGFAEAGDCASTLRVLAQLGVPITAAGSTVAVDGRGVERFREPNGPLDCGRSGTTMRLLAGILAGASFDTELTGDGQLLARPMERVAAPLRLMGARVELSPEGRPPMRLHPPAELRGIDYELPVASAQVKSAVLLAGLRANGSTSVIERLPSRDHTERMLAAMGARITVSQSGDLREVSVVGLGALHPFDLDVPGDLSSAAFVIAAAAMVPGSAVTIQNVGLNATRMGFVRVLQSMGADVQVDVISDQVEPAGHITVRYAPLQGASVEGAQIPLLIDELPLIGLVATRADGTTTVTGAQELRVKESDRIAGLVQGLRALGADADELADGFVVNGPTTLTGGEVDARDDHRLGMMFSVAALVAGGEVKVLGAESIGDSFPGFFTTMRSLAR
jgi:3-phosphoshikimate 1-carboxyvinyltransferase